MCQVKSKIQKPTSPQPIGTLKSPLEPLCKNRVYCLALKSRTGPGQSKARGGRHALNSSDPGQWQHRRDAERHTAELGLTASWWVNGSFQSKLYRLAPEEQSVPGVWEGTLSQKTNPRAQPLSCCLMKTDHFLKKLCIYLSFFMPTGFVDAEL